MSDSIEDKFLNLEATSVSPELTSNASDDFDVTVKFQTGELPSEPSNEIIGAETSKKSNLITNQEDIYTTANFKERNEKNKMKTATKVALGTAITLVTLIVIGLITGIIQDSPIAQFIPWLGNIPSLKKNGRKSIRIPCYDEEGSFVGIKTGFELNNILKMSSGKVSMAGSEVELRSWGGSKIFFVIPKSDTNSRIKLFVESLITTSSGNIVLQCISERTGSVSLNIGDATSII